MYSTAAAHAASREGSSSSYLWAMSWNSVMSSSICSSLSSSSAGPRQFSTSWRLIIVLASFRFALCSPLYITCATLRNPLLCFSQKNIPTRKHAGRDSNTDRSLAGESHVTRRYVYNFVAALHVSQAERDGCGSNLSDDGRAVCA